MRIHKITVAAGLALVSSAAFTQQTTGTATGLDKAFVQTEAPKGSNSPINSFVPVVDTAPNLDKVAPDGVSRHRMICRLKARPEGAEEEIVPQFECN